MAGRRVCLRSGGFCGTVLDRQQGGEALALKTPTPPQRGADGSGTDWIALSAPILPEPLPQIKHFSLVSSHGKPLSAPLSKPRSSYARGELCLIFAAFDKLGKLPAGKNPQRGSNPPSASGKISSTSWTAPKRKKPKRKSGNATPGRPRTRPPPPGSGGTQPLSRCSTNPLTATNAPA